MVKVYLDNCCYNRPYDDQSYIRISLETQAKLFVQEEIKNEKLLLATSYILLYEISKNPHSATKQAIINFVNNYSEVYVTSKNKTEIEKLADEIQLTGVKNMDALHVACAIFANADYFLTTDDRLLKYTTNKIKIMNPVTFVNETEEQND